MACTRLALVVFALTLLWRATSAADNSHYFDDQSNVTSSYVNQTVVDRVDVVSK